MDQYDEALRLGVNPTLLVKVSKADGTAIDGAVVKVESEDEDIGKASVVEHGNA